jgi:hypothetical protein
MHATIRHYVPGVESSQDWLHVWRALATALNGAAGFISFAVVATGDGGLAAITLFDDATSLAAADRWIEGWLADQKADLGRFQIHIATGEVVAQRGL